MSDFPRPGHDGPIRPVDAAAMWTETVRALPVGARVTGKVVGVPPFGAFLSLDGHPDAVGLARIDMMPRCQRLPAVGQAVTGEVAWHSDHNHQVGVRLSEWGSHEDLLPRFAERVGQDVVGRVTKIAPIGVFVRLADCVEGLVPAAEFAPAAADHAAAVREGQEISVRIVTVDLERPRILLTRRDREE